MGSQQIRPNYFVKDQDLDVTLGLYDDGIRLNYHIKSFKIGEKREDRAERKD